MRHRNPPHQHTAGLLLFWSQLTVCLCLLHCVAGEWEALIVSGYGTTIATYGFNITDGNLTAPSFSNSPPLPSFLAKSRDNRFIYACQEIEQGAVSAFSVNPSNGTLTLVNTVSSCGQGPAHIGIHQRYMRLLFSLLSEQMCSGRWLFVANYISGHLAVLPVRSDGSVGNCSQVFFAGTFQCLQVVS